MGIVRLLGRNDGIVLFHDNTTKSLQLGVACYRLLPSHLRAFQARTGLRPSGEVVHRPLHSPSDYSAYRPCRRYSTSPIHIIRRGRRFQDGLLPHQWGEDRGTSHSQEEPPAFDQACWDAQLGGSRIRFGFGLRGRGLFRLRDWLKCWPIVEKVRMTPGCSS